MKKVIKNRCLILLIIFSLINLFLNGCYSTRAVAINDEDEYKITKIVLKDSTEVDFTKIKPGYAAISENQILILNSKGLEETYPLNNVETIYAQEFDTLKTVGLAIALPTFMVLLFFTELIIHRNNGEASEKET